MKEQVKIYDVIFYFNEFELLEKRIEYLKDSIESFIILNFGNQQLNIENQKVIIIKIEKNFFDFFEVDDVKNLVNTFVKLGVKFTDTLIFSKVFEIPDKSVFKELQSELTKGPHMLKQKSLFWNQNLYSNNIHLSSMCTQLTHISQELRTFKRLEDIGYPIFLNCNSFYCGWYLNGFESDFESFTESFIFWNQLKTPKKEIQQRLLESKNSLKEFWLKRNPKKLHYDLNLEIPEIFKLPEVEFKFKERNILITQKGAQSPLFDWDEIFEIGSQEIIHHGHKTYKIKVPHSKWYDSSLNFSEEYVTNEILTILGELQFHDFDKIHITKKTDGQPSVYTYKDFKEQIPSEIF